MCDHYLQLSCENVGVPLQRKTEKGKNKNVKIWHTNIITTTNVNTSAARTSTTMSTTMSIITNTVMGTAIAAILGAAGEATMM